LPRFSTYCMLGNARTSGRLHSDHCQGRVRAGCLCFYIAAHCSIGFQPVFGLRAG
jgi:hypothetical protein